MSNQFKVSKLWAQRLQEHHISLQAVLRRAGLPAGFFQQEKIYVTTAELFALWRAVGETSGDPVIGLKLGAEARLERYDPAAIAAVCSRSFRDAVQRIAFYKQLTCPEEIRIRTGRDETSVEFAFIQAEGDEPDVLVDICLSWIFSIGRIGTDGNIKPLRVELIRPVRHRELLEAHFGSRVRFKAERNVLVFRSSDLDRPFTTHNEELLKIVGAQLDTEVPALIGRETADASERCERSASERAHTPASAYRCGDYVSATGGRNAPRPCAPLPETKRRRIERNRLLAGLSGCELILSRISRMGRHFTWGMANPASNARNVCTHGHTTSFPRGV